MELTRDQSLRIRAALEKELGSVIVFGKIHLSFADSKINGIVIEDNRRVKIR